MRRSLSSAFMALLLVHVLVGCNNFKPPPTYPREDPAYGAPTTDLTGVDKDEPATLVLLPGDTITVRTSSAEQASYEGLVIDAEGKVHVPIVGAVKIGGMTPQAAERGIETPLQKFDKFARVSVLVSKWGGHFATVIGAVVTEGAKELSPGMRLSDLVAAAGGPLRNTEGEIRYVADLDGARLVRGEKTLPVSLRIALTGDNRHNILLHPGDQLFVPAGFGNRIAILGDDARPGAMITYRPGMRLTEALASGGGINLASDSDDIRIIRGPLKKPMVYRFNLDAMVAGKTGDVELAPGDVVWVSRHWATTMTEVLNRVAPILSIAISGLTTYALVRTLQNQNNQNNN
jgi:polysaccharide export outer membrane protein